MTKDEQIMRAVAVLILRGHSTFTRKYIRDILGVSAAQWQNEYSPRFQGMRIDQLGGAPNVGNKWKDVFVQAKPQCIAHHEVRQNGLEIN